MKFSKSDVDAMKARMARSGIAPQKLAACVRKVPRLGEALAAPSVAKALPQALTEPNFRTFSVPGPLLGYRASVLRAFDPKYKAFKARVRALATAAGVPLAILSGEAGALRVNIHWRKKARIDGVNVFKAVEDAVWKQDRRVFRFDGNVTENWTGGECCIVHVATWRTP